MRVQFAKIPGAPERMVCEAELLFDDGPLEGTKLVGFSLWRTPDGEVYVNLPARSFGIGNDRRFFDFLRVQDTGDAATKRVKAWILNEFKNWA